MDIQLTEDAWLETYKPFINTLDENASWNGTLYETYGDEEDYIRQQDCQFIWTLTEYEGIQYIVNGIAYVNRLGYFICAVPWEEGLTITVTVEEN